MKTNIVKDLKLRNGREMLVGQLGCGYAYFKCGHDEIQVINKTKSNGTGYVVPIDSTGYAGIPKSIRVAYGLDRRITVEKTKDLIRIYAHADKIPKPFRGISATDNAEFNKDKMKKVGECWFHKNSAYRLYMNMILPKEWKYRKITVHVGECLRIDIGEANQTDMSKYPSHTDLKEEYGARMQYFAGKKLVFVDEVKNDTDYHTIQIPKIFKEKTGLTSEDIVECYEAEDEDGKKMFVLAPTVKACDFTGKKIDPKEEVPQKEVICEKCSDKKDDIGDLLTEVAEIKKLLINVSEKCNKYHKECEDLMKENKDLTEKLRSVLTILSN